jgi:NAD(P)-dependent dehydrogenase (short-subunit alcohol dehydrogenase family)/acyl carrier protein
MYIIVGGLGGLGRAILQWMVDRGARNVTVWSRSGVPHAHAGRMVEQLSARGVRITSTKCDITSETAVNEAMQALLTPSSLPIKGILHTAVTFSDTTFALLSHEQWALGLSAKVSGTKNLHAASLKHQLALDFFIMTSSYEAVVALPTQAAYCAANSFMDSFARYRRSLGLPACAVAFGLITEMGVGQTDVTRNMIARHDLYGTGERGFLQILEAAFLEQPATSASWAQFDPLAGSQITANLDPSKLAKQARSRQNGQIPRWRLDRKFAFVNRAIQDELTSSGLAVQHEESAPEVPAVLLAATDAIREGRVEDAEVAITLAMIERIAALRYLPPESFDARKSLAEYGIDSLGAVELRTWVVNTFRVAIPLMTLLDEALSLRDLGNMVAKGMKIDDA